MDRSTNMDELTLVARLRDDVPGIDLAGPQRRLADEIYATAAADGGSGWVGEARGTRPARVGGHGLAGRRRRAVVAGAVAAAAAVAAATVVIAVRGPSAHPAQIAVAPRPAVPAPGPAATAAQLVAYATRAAAAAAAFNPKPSDWVYTKTLNATSSA